MVDRTERDRLADALAAYLRGEADNFHLDKQVMPEHCPKDRTVRELGHVLWFAYDDFKSHPVSISPQGWNMLVRILAFLRSDLQVPVRSTRRPTVWSLTDLLWIILAVGCGVRWGWIGFAAAFAPLGPTLYLCRAIRRRPGEPSNCAPFESEAQWRAHAPLIEADRIPAYHREQHGQPIRRGSSLWWSRIACIPGGFILVFLLCPILLLVALLPGRMRD